jgi:2'-5' RNA ligase
MRLFTALDVPDALRTQIARLRAPEVLDGRWSPPEQYHVTLRFIGETSSDGADRLASRLDRVQAPPVELVPYGLDVLPSRRNPSVLIVGFERAAPLLSLYESVSEVLESEGLEPEDRSYRPHVTLARVRDVSAEAVHRFLDEHEAGALPSVRAEAFHLYESTLTPEGAVHERRRSFPLGP